MTVGFARKSGAVVLDPRDIQSGNARPEAQRFDSAALDGPAGVARQGVLAGPRDVAVPALEGAVRPAGAIQRGVKRVLDFTGASLVLLLVWPIMLAVAIIVKLDSHGPALFRQTRIGKDGRPFVFYKFRSMTHGCDQSLHKNHVTKLIEGELGDEDRGSDGSFKLECDPRVTQVGRVLRRTSMDELPQLFNVIKGEMSLIGPRPPLPYEVELYSDHDRRRLEVLPGMTGLWQVSGRTQLNYEESIDLDVEYVDNWSLALDARIALKTPGAVFGRKGAS